MAGELNINPCDVGFAAFFSSIDHVDLMEKHTDEKAIFVSGTKVRKPLGAGETPDPRIMRPEVAQILIDALKG